MKHKITLFIALFTLSISSAFAHALWIETSSTGKKGQAQDIKIFFGEYAAKEADSTIKWFSNVKEFSLVITAPNGTSKILKATPDVLFYKASFTPDQDGTYIVSIVHEVATIYDDAKIEYYAFANVAIGTAPKINAAFPSKALLTIRPSQSTFKVAETSSAQIIYDKTPFAKQKITVVSPDSKSQEIETDHNGKIVFKSEQKGNYFLEAFKENKTPGTLGGKPYSKVWHVVTYFTAVD